MSILIVWNSIRNLRPSRAVVGVRLGKTSEGSRLEGVAHATRTRFLYFYTQRMRPFRRKKWLRHPTCRHIEGLKDGVPSR